MYKHYPVFLLIFFTAVVNAQQPDTLKNERFSIHAQTTVVAQFKPAFKVPYTGANSLLPKRETQTSITSTLFLGAALWRGATVFINPEIAGGSGLSQALGVADATNGETFRVGDPSPKIYLARLFLRQVFALSSNTTYHQSDINLVAQHSPDKYISVTAGKLGMADYFDNNAYSHDPRTQFLSWGLMSNGAWDYPANTRGYTPSVIVDYVTPFNEMRYGLSLVPLTANGNEMNWKVSQASSQTVEFTHRYSINKKNGAVRLLGFYTSANMGNYRQSIAAAAQNPVVQDTRKFGNHKYGFGINAEQKLTASLGCFAKASWNDGNNETWMFTEIDRSASAGLSLAGERWKRKNDNAGLAFVISGISQPHQDYLKAGGAGFMLGDGKLSYAPESVTEFYYSAELVSGQLYVTGTYQLLLNPGYNKDRHGPVNIFSLRVHTKI